MKKLSVIILILVLSITAAMAEGWPEGLSPEQPYAGSPAVDFNKTIGYMIRIPFSGDNIAPGKTDLRILLPREDIEIGTGKLSVYSEEDGLIDEIAVNGENVSLSPLAEEELAALVWGCGSSLDISLNENLPANRHLYVKMSDGCIKSETYGIASAKIDSNTGWTFTTETDNYIDSFAYVRPLEDGKEKSGIKAIKAGDMAKIGVALGEKASAAVFCNSGEIDCADKNKTESGEIAVTFPSAGTVEWGILFVDADGNNEYFVSYTTVVNEAE